MKSKSFLFVQAGRAGLDGSHGGGARTPHTSFRGCQPVGLEALAYRSSDRTFALQVEDESMIGRHLLPGDVVVLEHGRLPRPGDIVAALVDNESVLREYRVENGRALLHAAHPALTRTIPARDLVIQGVMVRLIRTP